MATEQTKVEIGLGIGQVLSVKLSDKERAALRKAVENGGWYDLDTSEGTVTINLATILFIRVSDPDKGIGFSS